MQIPQRKPIDVEIDRYWHLLVHATTQDARRAYGETYTKLIRQRNAERTPEEIEALERERGLR